MLKKFNQTIIFIVLILVLTLSASTSPPVLNDPYTGLYYVYGSKIVTYYNCAFIELCGPDHGPFIDTTNIASVVIVKWMDEKKDTLHFFGLPGADEGEIKLYNGRRQLKDNAGTLQHYDELEGYKIYGVLIDNKFEIHYQRVDNFYEATGVIIQNKIKLQAQYTVRTTTIEYDLAGEKIVN